jgi:hypothetical protein
MLAGAATGSDSTETVTGSGEAVAPGDVGGVIGAAAGGNAGIARRGAVLGPGPGDDPGAVDPADVAVGVRCSHPARSLRRSTRPAAAIVAPAARATQMPIGSLAWP